MKPVKNIPESMMTLAERAVNDRRNKVCRDFFESWKEAPVCSPNRHIESVAKKHKLTPVGVKKILTDRGIYRVNGRHPLIVVSAI